MSVAVEGSKGALWASVEAGEEDGFLPVKASQNDILTVESGEKGSLKTRWIMDRVMVGSFGKGKS